jgi:methionyl-tRNA formyltransferase
MEVIAAAGGRLSAAMTIPDDRAVRKSGRVFIDAHCTQHGIPLGKFRNINDPDALDWLRAQDLDWLFIIGWSQIAGPDVLASVRQGAIGMHPTLLPQGRGRAAIPWAILKGLDRTGVTMFKLDAGVDSGPIIAQREVPIGPRETATTLYARVEDAHRALMREAWPQLRAGRVTLTPQDESKATYWPGRTPEDGRLLPSMSVQEADRLVRAVTHPYPGAFIDLPEGRLRVWEASIAGGGAGTTSIEGAKMLRSTTRSLQFADGPMYLRDYSCEVLSVPHPVSETC